jgi:hypothetical protein
MYTAPMLSIVRTPEGLGLQIQHVSPMVYLDHWAFRRFSDEPALAARLVEALQARRGTLALSWLNLGEYATVSAAESRRAAESFVQSVLPAIFCIQVEPFAVDQRGRAGDLLPHADEALASLLVDITKLDDKPFTAVGLFEPLYNAGLAAAKDRLAAITQGRLEFLRHEFHRDPDLAKAVKHAEHPDALANTTRIRAIVRTLAATFFPDLRRPITPNDAIDFLHAAIPIHCCDLVLLDGGMRDHVERARLRFKDTRIKLATVFSGQDGVDRVLDYLEKSGA